jgi:hypothetical protein
MSSKTTYGARERRKSFLFHHFRSLAHLTTYSLAQGFRADCGAQHTPTYTIAALNSALT